MYFMWNETLQGGTIETTNFTEKPDIGIDYVWLHFTESECLYRMKDSQIQNASPDLINKIQKVYDQYKSKYIKKSENISKEERSQRF